MNILSENSILNERTISTARRVVSIAVGATVGISMGLTSVQASQPGRALMVGYHSIGRLELASRTPVVIHTTSTELLPELAPSQAPRLVYGLAPVRTARARTAKWHQVGLASWYGQQFQGRQTANGEVFDMNELSCAHTAPCRWEPGSKSPIYTTINGWCCGSMTVARCQRLASLISRPRPRTCWACGRRGFRASVWM